MKKAFTLIELMIVVAIIAIIAAIAIPNLVESKKSANETATISTLKSVCTAQQTFQSNNYSNVAANTTAGGYQSSPAIKHFAPSMGNLGGSTDVMVDYNAANLKLLPDAPCESVAAGTAAYNGYNYSDLPGDATSATAYADGDYKYGYGVAAAPAVQGTTGQNVFAVDGGGAVLMNSSVSAAPAVMPSPSSTWVAAQ